MSLLFTLKSHTATLRPENHDLKSCVDLSTYRRYLLQKYKLICKSALNYEKRCVKKVFGGQKWLVSPSKPTKKGSKKLEENKINPVPGVRYGVVRAVIKEYYSLIILVCINSSSVTRFNFGKNVVRSTLKWLSSDTK